MSPRCYSPRVRRRRHSAGRYPSSLVHRRIESQYRTSRRHSASPSGDPWRAHSPAQARKTHPKHVFRRVSQQPYVSPVARAVPTASPRSVDFEKAACSAVAVPHVDTVRLSKTSCQTNRLVSYPRTGLRNPGQLPDRVHDGGSGFASYDHVAMLWRRPDIYVTRAAGRRGRGRCTWQRFIHLKLRLLDYDSQAWFRQSGTPEGSAQEISTGTADRVSVTRLTGAFGRPGYDGSLQAVANRIRSDASLRSSLVLMFER